MIKEPHFISVSKGGCEYDYENMTFEEHEKAMIFHSKEKLKYNNSDTYIHLYYENLNLERWHREGQIIKSNLTVCR